MKVVVNELINGYAAMMWQGQSLDQKTITLPEWLRFFSAALGGEIDGIDVDIERTAMALDYLINEGSLQMTLEELSL